MGSEQQRELSAVTRFVAADDVASRVDPGRHARFAHPVGDQVGGLAMCRSEIEPREPAGLVADGRQFGKPVGDRLAKSYLAKSRLAKLQLVRCFAHGRMPLKLSLNGGIVWRGQLRGHLKTPPALCHGAALSALLAGARAL